MRIKLILALAAVLTFDSGFSCSVFKVTENGKTLVGNNEDFFSPSTKIWFEPGENDQFGVANLGFDNGFPQGALNTAGLVFDGFAMQYLAVNDTMGKLNIPNTEYIPHIMQNFETVREVKDYFKTINLAHLSTSMYLFVDKTGEYLIVEGDSLILGNDAVFTLSNFYPSQVSNQDEVPIPFYQNGKNYIKNNPPKADFLSCTHVMKNLHQEITQYSSIYDLNGGNIKIHHFHNYEDEIEFNLQKELSQTAHEYIIPELFSKESEGYKFYYIYNNDAEELTKRFESRWDQVQDKYDAQTLQMIAGELESMVNRVGYEWLRRNQIDGSIILFKFNVRLFPNSSNAYDSLGEAYMKSGQYKLSIKNYKKAIKLNKKNPASRETLKKVKILKKG